MTNTNLSPSIKAKLDRIHTRIKFHKALADVSVTCAAWNGLMTVVSVFVASLSPFTTMYAALAIACALGAWLSGRAAMAARKQWVHTCPCEGCKKFLARMDKK